MAVSYPGISYLRGYEPKDPLEQFAKGFGFGEGIRNEAGAKDALTAYIDSLTGGQAQAPAGSQRNVVDQSIASARAVQPPAALTAAMDANYKPGDAAGRAMQFFMSKGYSQPQAAGIVGNLMQESGLNVGAINPGDGRDGSDSIGIAQWNGPRAQALRAYAAQNGLDLNDLDTQFGFIDHELRGTEKGAFDRLMQAQDPIQAAAAFVGYERPQGWTAENPYNSHGWGNRARHAAQLAGGTYDAGAQQGSQSGSTMPRAEILKALVQNPLTREFGLQVATGKVDPALAQKGVVINDRLVNPLTGQIIGDYSDAAQGGGPADLGLNPQYGIDASGNPVLIQLGKDGRGHQTQLPEGVTLAKEPIRLDAGTHFVLLDPITRQPVGQVPKENYQEAYDAAAGAAAGKSDEQRRTDAPAAIASAENSLAQIDAVINDPNLHLAVGLGGLLPAIANTPQAGTVARIEQLQGAAFLQAFEALKGGGQITEIEGKKATDAIARLSRVQNQEDFTVALRDLRGVIQAGLDRARASGSRATPGQQTSTGIQWSFEP